VKELAVDFGRLGTADIARLLGVSRPRVWQLRQQPGFPKPAGEEGGREYWYEDAILRWAAGAGRTLARRAPLLYRPAASEYAARYEGARVIVGYIVLSWDSSLGRICLLYPPPGHAWTSAERLAELVPQAAVAVGVRFDYDAWGPNLEAVDLDAPGRRYRPRWTDLARILGAPAPWWPFELRKPEEILRWRPGSPPTVTQAIPDPDTGPLLRLAIDQPDDSSAKTTLLHLDRTIQQQATDSAVRAVELLDELADRDVIALAATPAPTRPPDDEEPPEHIRRDGWIQVVHCDDTTAAECVAIVLAWDGGRDLPFATLAEIHPALDPLAAEWVQTLVPTKRTAEFALFDERGVVRTLRDPATDLPATEDDAGVIRAAVPQFLPALAPLAEVILGEGEHVVWIRTADRRLYIAPEQPGAGVSWGYSGSGPHTLAELLDRLLDDINAPAPAINSSRPIPVGLLAGTTGGWETGAVLTRAELLAARDRR
jgi:predicted DNA-binding transcriptional regulator AlpA